jgi:hypothetical protein
MLKSGLYLNLALGFAEACVHQNDKMKPSISVLRIANVVFHFIGSHVKSMMSTQIADNQCNICQIIANNSRSSKIVDV